MTKFCLLLTLLCTYAAGQAQLRRLIYPIATIGADETVLKRPTTSSSLLKSGYLEFSNPLWHVMSRAGDYFQRFGRSPFGLRSYISSVPPMNYRGFPLWVKTSAQDENDY